MFCTVWDYTKSKLKDKKYKQKTSLKSYKTEINIHANPLTTGPCRTEQQQDKREGGGESMTCIDVVWFPWKL